ncbi:MAG TPA: ATP-binding protein [Bryobacteraceae bacterium]|jgi:PAS domain S-box-containing protein|nr:ATP-binding protein [Bryobacteraceae bacterium]
MRKRLFYWFATVFLAISVVLVVWEGSVRVRSTNPTQTFIFWAISILTFVVMVTLGWIVFRTGVKLYMERQANREGSRIRTKLVLGALTLVSAPVVCLVLSSYFVFSYNMTAWFTEPMTNQMETFKEMARMFKKELLDETTAQAGLLAAQPETVLLVRNGVRTPGALAEFCQINESTSVAVYGMNGGDPLDSWGPYDAPADPEHEVVADYAVRDGARLLGRVVLTAGIPLDLQQKRIYIENAVRQGQELHDQRTSTRLYYIMLEALITLFVLYVATWIALFLARQISVPITAILEGASQVRKGNLQYRVQAKAVDELGLLVRGFNQMTEELETGASELDRRRRFTEAILESIPTGVLSIAADGSIQRVNQALLKIFPQGQVARATRLEDLFSRDDTAEIKYLMKRARRTGLAARQMDLTIERRTINLSVTVAAIEEKLTSGFVLVLEDTSELLRAQKAAAWHEVARRVAHEIKNPLTPIALSAERIDRQMDRLDLPHPAARIIRECADTISKSVESVKTLVDEFSQFARFPAAQPVRSDLNDVVRNAVAVFKDRLEGIAIQTSFATDLPAVNLDREQFQRVVVNLVDNAAEAMQDSLVKTLLVATQPGGAESVELVVADSGPGVSPEDKEKLFLPYFSTKNRGTGLGLAIVSHIVAEHGGSIRVEDNKPTGARFTVEIPALIDSDSGAPDSVRPAVART